MVKRKRNNLSNFLTGVSKPTGIFRNILLLTGLSTIDDLQPSTVNKIKYKEMQDRDKWRIPLIKEVIDMKYGNTIPEGWTQEELDEILEFACTD